MEFFWLDFSKRKNEISNLNKKNNKLLKNELILINDYAY